MTIDDENRPARQRVTLTDIAYASWDGPPSTRGDLPTALDYRKLTPIVLRQALARAGTRVCEPVLRVSLEVPTESTTASGASVRTASSSAALIATLSHSVPIGSSHDCPTCARAASVAMSRGSA